MIKAADPLMEQERMSQRATTPAPAPASHSPASAPVPVEAPFTASTQQSPTSAPARVLIRVDAHVRWEPQVEGMMRIEASFPQYETKVIEPVGAKKHVKVVGGGV